VRKKIGHLESRLAWKGRRRGTTERSFSGRKEEMLDNQLERKESEEERLNTEQERLRGEQERLDSEQMSLTDSS
jgi:hypothetical protein